MKLRASARAALALLLPPLAGGVVWLTLLRPVEREATAARRVWQAEAGRVEKLADHATELADGHLVEAMEQVAWLRERLRPGAAATFLEEVARASEALSIESVEVRRPGSERDPATGLRLDQVALRVVAPYAKIVRLWSRVQRHQATALCHRISLSRYGDRVAATFQVALPVAPEEGR